MSTNLYARAENWAHHLYRDSVDRKDAAGFAAVFAEDGTLRFGNEEPLHGRPAIEAAIAHFFQARSRCSTSSPRSPAMATRSSLKPSSLITGTMVA